MKLQAQAHFLHEKPRDSFISDLFMTTENEKLSNRNNDSRKYKTSQKKPSRTAHQPNNWKLLRIFLINFGSMETSRFKILPGNLRAFCSIQFLVLIQCDLFSRVHLNRIFIFDQVLCKNKNARLWIFNCSINNFNYCEMCAIAKTSKLLKNAFPDLNDAFLLARLEFALLQ